MHIGQERDFITGGNQKWKGATPNLIKRPKTMPRIRAGLDAVNKIIIDPSAWVKKYLIAASASWCHEEAEIRGINESIFNSSASQIISQWLEERARNVLKNKVDEKRKV